MGIFFHLSSSSSLINYININPIYISKNTIIPNYAKYNILSIKLDLNGIYLASIRGDINDCTQMIEVFTTIVVYTLLNICNKQTPSFNQKKYRLPLYIMKKLNMCSNIHRSIVDTSYRSKWHQA